MGTCRLKEHQKVILAGCFSGVVPTLSCEAEEADTVCSEKSRNT